MTVEIKANEIKNETIAKLTRDEIGKFGFLNIGIYAYTIREHLSAESKVSRLQ